MMDHMDNSSPLNVGLLTVGLESQAVERIQHSLEVGGWELAHVGYESYFSNSKRPHLTKQILDCQACVAVIDFDRDPDSALDTAECIRQSFYQRLAIIALSSSTDPDLLLRAMRAGCSEFVDHSFSDSEFQEMVARLNQRWSTSRNSGPKSGKIISFFGAKGGVGTTLLAVHLTTYLARHLSKKVLLIDNHGSLGHVCLYLGLDGAHHYFDELVRNISRLDEDLLRGFIAAHSSGLDVLSSPDVHGGVRKADAAAMERTLEFLGTQYDYIVLDCDTSFDESNLALIDLCTSVYLIATPEIGAIRDLSRYVDGLVQNERVINKLQIVINRYSSREAVSIEQIEKAVRLPIAVKISNSYSEAVRAINIGEPLSPERKSDFAQQLMKWATTVAGTGEASLKTSAKRRFALWK